MSSKAAFETTFRITGSFQNKHRVTSGFLITARNSLGRVSDFKITVQKHEKFFVFDFLMNKESKTFENYSCTNRKY
jgi:hypothetical protein